MPIKKSAIQLDVNGKPVHAYLAAPSGGGPGVLVLPSWFGLKTYFKDVCDRLAEEGYTALGLDYYQGRVGQTVDEAQSLQQKVEGDPDALEAMVRAALDHLVSLNEGKGVGVVGFSMGTDWAVITAAKDPAIAATVLFYGGYTPDFSNMKSKVLGHYAESDQWVSFEGIQDMEAKMKAAGVDVTIYRYPGTAHWFMEEDRPEHDPDSASLAWDRTLEFLKQNLR